MQRDIPVAATLALRKRTLSTKPIQRPINLTTLAAQRERGRGAQRWRSEDLDEEGAEGEEDEYEH